MHIKINQYSPSLLQRILICLGEGRTHDYRSLGISEIKELNKILYWKTSQFFIFQCVLWIPKKLYPRKLFLNLFKKALDAGFLGLMFRKVVRVGQFTTEHRTESWILFTLPCIAICSYILMLLGKQCCLDLTKRVWLCFFYSLYSYS